MTPSERKLSETAKMITETDKKIVFNLERNNEDPPSHRLRDLTSALCFNYCIIKNQW